MRYRLKKLLKILIILIIIVAAFVWFAWSRDYSDKNRPMLFGVNFSEPQAEYLGLDWKKTYLALLDDLKIKKLRLSAFWTMIEPQEGKFDFKDLDWQVNEAKKRGATVVMAIGRRLPHWPECHTPDWAAKLPEDQQKQKINKMLKTVVEHYKNSSNVMMWQVDNEPFVNWFGTCPKADPEFFKSEVALTRTLDKRPILVTDSGELSLWRRASKVGDYLGTTMYRVVWNKYIGYWYYKFIAPPAVYNWKARFISGLHPESIIIAELQAEPWLREDISKISLEEQRKSFNAASLLENANFARRTGFSESYLWGAEYWYWLKTKQNDASVWEAAKTLF